MGFSLTKEAITRLVIMKLEDRDQPNSDSAFEVQFNPGEFSQTYEVEWEEQEGDGATDAEQSFKRIKPTDLSISIVLDGTGATGEVTESVTDRVEKLLDLAYSYNSDTHQPNPLFISWGHLQYPGVLESMGVNYTLFDPDGNPLRAKIDLTFKSHQTQEDQAAEQSSNSPDVTHLRVVNDGDTLPLMCYKIYGDSKYYLEVANANNITNHRKLITGSRIYFPPLKETADA